MITQRVWGKRVDWKTRLVSQIEKTEGCWNWNGSLDRDGYGKFYLDGNHSHSHRAMWVMLYGEPGMDQIVCHRCDNRKCVRPSHLFLSTWAGNMADRDLKGRHGRWLAHHPSFVGLLHQARKMREDGISQNRIAGRLGISQGTISQWEKKGWPIPTLVEIRSGEDTDFEKINVEIQVPRDTMRNAKGSSLRERFESFVLRTYKGCWMWSGKLNEKGYGHLMVNGKPVKAHRIAWELYRGPIPEKMNILHICDIPSCVNPDHLRLGTIADNNRDGQDKGRMYQSDQQRAKALKRWANTPRFQGCSLCKKEEGDLVRYGNSRAHKECVREYKHRWYLSHKKESH